MQSIGNEALETALRQCGAGELAHTGRTLDVHLMRTAALLQSWGCPEHICMAGMFHSIYGTNQFDVACVDVSKREWLVKLIGREAERLVYLFCVSDRPQALLRGFGTHCLVDRTTGDAHPASLEELQALLAIECANLLEQGARSGLLETLLALSSDRRTALLGPDVAQAVSYASLNQGIHDAK